MVFRVLGFVSVMVLALAGCGDDSGGGAGAGGGMGCSGGVSNGIVEAGEQCDGVSLQGMTCATLGLGGGTLMCTAACTYDTSMCGGTGVGTAGTGS